jgi:predicted acetyltransferase
MLRRPRGDALLEPFGPHEVDRDRTRRAQVHRLHTFLLSVLGCGRCQDRLLLRHGQLHDGHIRYKRVTIGYIIDPGRHQEGIATEAVSAMLDFCFGELHLHRVQAFIQPDNTASRKLVEKLGFRSEGLLRDNLRVGGAWRDEMLFALLETDWRS